MKIEVLADVEAVAKAAAGQIAAAAREDVAARGRFVLAVSGGRTPWQMLRALANEDVPWNGIEVVQVFGCGNPVEQRVGHALRLSRAAAQNAKAC